MKVTAKKDNLLEAVALAERVTGKRESLPILSCVLLDVGKTCVVRATNLEAAFEASVQVDAEEKGVVAVPAGVLSQTLRSISDGKVTLKTEEGNLVVSSKGTRTLIKGVPHDEFPTLPSLSDKKGITVSREELMHGMQAVSYAASPSMIRPELGSIFISLSPERILCVATDSFRLAEKSIPLRGKGSVELLIPLKHAQELAHILESVSAETLELVAEESQVAVRTGDLSYTSRVIEGTFPNYKEIIPKKFETEATVLRGDFAEMLKKARVFSGNDQHVGLHVYPKRKIFSATARSADVGEMSDSIGAALSGEDLDINFHIGYLADCLGTISTDSIVLGFSGAGRPLVIRGVSDASFMYLVMPLNR